MGLIESVKVALLTSPVAYDYKSIWNTVFSGKNGVKGMIQDLAIPGALVICAGLLVGQVVRCYKDYKQTGDVQWGPLIVLGIVIAMLIAFKTSNALWSIVGLG